MAMKTGSSALASLLILIALPAFANDYIYVPQPAGTEEVSSNAESVLVREVEIHKGDTLSKISKRFSGRGSYFPQILLFNAIKNPDLIYPGNVLRVPVTKSGKVAAAKASKGKIKAAPAAKTAANPPVMKDTAKPAVVSQSKSVQPVPVEPVKSPVVLSGEQALYAGGVAAYKKGDCKTALESFDKFVANYPDSALLPDVTLYRAECLLKLSSQ